MHGQLEIMLTAQPITIVPHALVFTLANHEHATTAPAAPAPAPAPAPIAVVDDKELDKALAEQVAELKRNSVSGTQTLEQLQSSVSNGDAADPVRREESTDREWPTASPVTPLCVVSHCSYFHARRCLDEIIVSFTVRKRARE